MKIMGHNIPFYKCSLLKEKQPAVIVDCVMAAKNAAERRQRLQWLWEGSLMYHMTRKTYEGQELPQGGCPIEHALFKDLVHSIASPDNTLDREREVVKNNR